MAAVGDLLSLVIYDLVVTAFVSIEVAGTGAQGSVRINLPAKFSGNKVHVYPSFFSPELQISSTNQYLGELKSDKF